MKTTSTSQKLKTLRRNRHWSQQYMADLLGLSVPAYSKLERSLTGISISRLKLLAIIFEVKASWLLDEEEDEVYKENVLLKEKLKASNAEVIVLQRKLIACYNENDRLTLLPE